MAHLFATTLVLAFAALVILGGVWDAASYTIPNWISLALAALFVLAVLALRLPLPTAGWHAAVGAIALVVGIAMFAFGWIGGGDAKLFAAAALWLGPGAATSYLAATGIAGGVLAAVLLALRSDMIRPTALLGPRWVARLAEPGGGIPYGLAICAGALTALPSSVLMVAFGR
jgi:prepilin peptidase CpaA